MLVVDRVSKSYPTPTGPLSILEDLSLTVERGDSVAIMGPSGCGKSTLLYLIGALEPPTSGTVTLDGTNPSALREDAQAAFRGQQIGFVFQDHLLLPQLSALDNVLAPTLVAPSANGAGGAVARGPAVAAGRRASDRVSIIGRASSLAVSGSGSPSRVRWFAAPPSWSAMNPPAISTAHRQRQPRTCWSTCTAPSRRCSWS